MRQELTTKSLDYLIAVSENKLKNGVKWEDAVNEAFRRWLNMTHDERELYRDDLKPRITRRQTRKLELLKEKYDLL